MNDNEIIFISNQTIKSFNDATGEIGAHSIVFGDKDNKDFHGNWFTKNTFLGHNGGDNAVALINHRVPLFRKGQFDPDTEKMLKAISDMRMKNPVQDTIDDVGIFSKLVCDLSDKYEKMVYDLAKRGVFKWSSGTAPQTYKANKSGELEMFVVVEKSLTPVPAEYRMLEHRVMPLKAYTDFIQKADESFLNHTVEGFLSGYPASNQTVTGFLKAYQSDPVEIFAEGMKGGKGSGHWGHAGRDAENLRGGSTAREANRRIVEDEILAPNRDKAKQRNPELADVEMVSGHLNFRTLGERGMYPISNGKHQPSLGKEIDYYNSNGDKRSGYVLNMDGESITIRDMNTKEKVTQIFVDAVTGYPVRLY